MKNPAVFTLSLDCEGLWGMADQPEVVYGGVINQQSLQKTYDFIEATLDRHGIRCTAAFVTAFASGPELIRLHIPEITEMSRLLPSWFVHISPALAKGKFDGWDGQKFFSQLARAGHEMAWHGTTHLPLEPSTPDEAVKIEMYIALSLFKHLGCTPSSIVFPRNKVGHLSHLKNAGFEVYRSERGGNPFSRLTGLARELNVFDARVEDTPSFEDGWTVLPPGDFLNWPAKIRGVIPPPSHHNALEVTSQSCGK